MRVTDEMIEWLEDAASYFENRPTNGEDRAHWVNVYNADQCRKIKYALTAALARGGEAEPESCGCPTIEHCDGSCAPYIGRKTDPVPQPSIPVKALKHKAQQIADSSGREQGEARNAD